MTLRNRAEIDEGFFFFDFLLFDSSCISALNSSMMMTYLLRYHWHIYCTIKINGNRKKKQVEFILFCSIGNKKSLLSEDKIRNEQFHRNVTWITKLFCLFFFLNPKIQKENMKTGTSNKLWLINIFCSMEFWNKQVLANVHRNLRV